MKRRQLLNHFAISVMIFFSCSDLRAAIYPLPKAGDDIVGQIKTASVQPGQTFFDIALQHDVGYVELMEANPDVNSENLEAGTVLLIPSQYVLPNAPREGIVVNVAEMRLYFYAANKREVMTYPIGIGRKGESTPEGDMILTQLTEKPTWHPTQDFRLKQEKAGLTAPKEVPPGPNNPLGEYSARLSVYPYLIHGSNDDRGVGRRSSAGCIRMYNKDIKELFAHLKKGLPVMIINEPFKVGQHGKKVYLEPHVPLVEQSEKYADLKKALHEGFRWVLAPHQVVDWSQLFVVAEEAQGVPQPVGKVLLDKAQAKSANT